MRVEYGEATTTIDPTGAHAVAQAFPRTYGQRLVTFLAPDDTAGADKAVDERPPIRSCSTASPGRLMIYPMGICDADTMIVLILQSGRGLLREAVTWRAQCGLGAP